jgi:UDP-4-amino-4,6-dideoxy-N-acetyl-beta-L-altrosamine transaminase
VSTPQPFLPYGRHVIDDADVAAVEAVLRGDWLTTGPSVPMFEGTVAEALGAAHVVACSSATAGLHIAAMAAGLGPGDLAVVPAITFLATANAIRYVGADVMFADVDPDTSLMRPSDLAAALARAQSMGRRVKAVLPVHMGGQCEDMAAIAELAKRAGAIVIEDASHAIGTMWGNTRIGDCAYSSMTVFSFHPVKTVAAGEGGAVTTNDPVLAERLRRARSHGMVREPSEIVRKDLGFDADGAQNPWYYEMSEPGFNYRMTDIQAALATSQMLKLDAFVTRRAHLRALYQGKLAALPGVELVAATSDARTGWHLAVALIPFERIGISRRVVMERMKAQGIGTQVHYIPVPWQPYYARIEPGTDYPGAKGYYDRALSLPLYPGMLDSDVDRVVLALAEALDT